MKLKKIVGLAVVFVFVAGCALFAQTAEYTTLLKKAKDFEEKKLYASALCTYYDALEADPSQKDSEDMQNYKKLGSCIDIGNPGYGEFDEFSLYDDWLVLLKDFEQYWTENPPIAVQFEDIEKGKIDRETRTASYSVKTWYGYTLKAIKIGVKIINGLDKVRRDDWDGISFYWPHVSVYQNDVEKDGKYLRNGAALFRAPHDWGAADAWNLDERIASAPFSMGILWENAKTYKTYNGKFLFEFQLALVDENGKVLAKNTSYERHDSSWNNSSGYYDVFTFDGVTQDSMKIIDSGKAKIVITKASLRYGKTTVNNADNLDKDWEKLQIKEYDPSKIFINKKQEENVHEGK